MKKLFLALLIVFFAASSCPAQKSNPAEMIETQKGRKFTITLPANPTTGYQWQLAKPLNDKMIKLISSEYIADDTLLIGSGGKQVWKFRAIKDGYAAIAFKYVRSWEKKEEPADEKYFIVNIR